MYIPTCMPALPRVLTDASVYHLLLKLKGLIPSEQGFILCMWVHVVCLLYMYLLDALILEFVYQLFVPTFIQK